MAELIGIVFNRDAHNCTSLNCDAFNRVTGFALTDNEFALVQQAHTNFFNITRTSSVLNRPS